MHMSSSYAVSIVTGSSVDISGKPNGYRLLLQLSSSAEVPPSELDLTKVQDGTYTSDDTFGPYGKYTRANLAFVSNDNSLQFNKWHHVAIRWGTNTINDGTGSFTIDGVDRGTFVIPSSSVIPQNFDDPLGDPDALFIGNFYEGENKADFDLSEFNFISQFFNANAAYTEGVTDYTNGSWTEDPAEYTLRHPLEAELHEIKVYNTYRDDNDISYAMKSGVEDISSEIEVEVVEEKQPEIEHKEELNLKHADLKSEIQINQQNYEKLIDEATNEISSFIEKANLENLS